jgi:uncharacterized peroxidase-related enzyme
MSQPDHAIALNLPLKDNTELDEDVRGAFEFLEREHGLLPNVLKAYTFDQDKLRPFMAIYNSIMLDPSELSELEREMIGVVVSSCNRCVYCLTAHGAAVRGLSGDPVLGELLVQNYRTAKLSLRHRAMLDFAVKLTERPWEVVEQDREALREHRFSERAIFDICQTAALFNFTNRMASGTEMMPNAEYHSWHR